MDNFRADVEAALTPHRPGTMSCGWGSEAPGSRPCKEPGCKNSAQFHFAGYCSNCAVAHNIPLLKVTPEAADEQADDGCCNSR